MEIAISPGSAKAAISATTAPGSVGCSGSSAANPAIRSSALARGPTGRVGTDASHSNA
ncbi:MAG: hypothetical protein M3021_02620 [Actinomycetota bacterium]|nr:hypothetical protein [Actinomycetota bacterium]